MRDGWYKYETHYAIGGVKIKDNIIVETAPIFKKLVGKSAHVVKGKVEFIIKGE